MREVGKREVGSEKYDSQLLTPIFQPKKQKLWK